MTRVDREQLQMFLREALEAYEAARRIVGSYSLEEFLASMEARYALRYALILLTESIADMLVLILETDYGATPESYRDAMLMAGEEGVIPYSDARTLAGLAALRNMLVHRYWRVSDERVYRETRKGLSSVARVLEALRKYVEASDP